MRRFDVLVLSLFSIFLFSCSQTESDEVILAKELTGYASLDNTNNIETDKWWKQDLGIYSNLYDTLLAENFEQREVRFFAEAENLKSLACRSEIVFNKFERDINKCRSGADNQFVKEAKKLFYLKKEDEGFGGIKFSQQEYKYLEPSIAATLILASWSAMMQGCIPENQGKKNTSSSPFIKGCEEEYTNYTYANLYNADLYTRVKFLERRGLLVPNNQTQYDFQSNNVLDANTYDVSKLIQYLEIEFMEVYCRSALGIKIEDDDECFDKAENFHKNITKHFSADIKNNNIKYLDKSTVEAFGLQIMTLTFEKCAPYNLFLDEKFHIKKVSKEEHEQIANDAINCVSKTFGAFFVPSLLEAELILKREAAWKKEVERKREAAWKKEVERKRQLRVAEAKLKRERDARALQIQKEKEAERESVGNFFGRLLIAVISESADAYFQDKIAKELNIKTGTYHSQDSRYCYYSSPKGMKKIKKKGGKSTTINLGNVGTLKPFITTSKLPGGWSQKTTIYDSSTSFALKETKNTFYECPRRIE